MDFGAAGDGLAGPLYSARPGTFAAAAIALPAALGDQLQPRLVDVRGGSAVAVYEDIEVGDIHVLRLGSDRRSWEALPDPNADIRARMSRYLRQTRPVSTETDPFVAASFGEGGIPNAVVGIDGSSVLIARIGNEIWWDSDPVVTGACPAGPDARCLFLWTWNGSEWTEQIRPIPVEFGFAPYSLSSTRLSGYVHHIFSSPMTYQWFEISLSTFAVTPGAPITWPDSTLAARIGREAITGAGFPDRIFCVRDRCHTVPFTSWYNVQVDQWDSPTLAMSCTRRDCQVLDLASGAVSAVTIPTTASELALRGMLPEPDGSGTRVFVYDSDVTDSLLELVYVRGATSMTAAPSTIASELFTSIMLADTTAPLNDLAFGSPIFILP